MHPDLSAILLSEEELSFRVTELGRCETLELPGG